MKYNGRGEPGRKNVSFSIDGCRCESCYWLTFTATGPPSRQLTKTTTSAFAWAISSTTHSTRFRVSIGCGSRALHTVRGNHDHGVAQNITVSGQNGFKYLTGVTRPLTRALLNSEDTRFLATLPLTQLITLDDLRFLLVHATPRDPLDEYAPADADFCAAGSSTSMLT